MGMGVGLGQGRRKIEGGKYRISGEEISAEEKVKVKVKEGGGDIHRMRGGVGGGMIMIVNRRMPTIMIPITTVTLTTTVR